MTGPEKKDHNYIRVEDSVGKVLMHDITCIEPGRFKGPAFRKGYIIAEDDIEKLKDLGKEKIFVFDIDPGEYHENDAAELFKKIAGDNITAEGPTEGKVTFLCDTAGMIIIDKRAVDGINSAGPIAFATVHSHIPVSKRDKVGGIRVVPLTISKEIVHDALEFIKEPVISLRPYKKKNIGLIVTGSEVASGRIKDGFRPVIEEKVRRYNSEIAEFRIVSDSCDTLKRHIEDLAQSGCELIILTGGMSVDPDDITKTAIGDTATEVISYGAPLLPGNMLMVSYKGPVAVLGVPACALFYSITVLDVFLPYIFSDTRITKQDIVSRGYGGYCRHCDVCVYPKCGFGKC